MKNMEYIEELQPKNGVWLSQAILFHKIFN